MLQISLPHKITIGLGAIALAVLILAVGAASNASAATAPTLGNAGSYAVIAGSTVTNTGSSTITGDLGVSPGSAVTGFPPGLVSNGSIHSADANAGRAQSDVTTAYNALDTAPCNFDLTGQDLGGLTLTEGVYCFDTSAQLTGQLTLDAQGNPAAVFIFEMGSTLITASNASVLVTNGGADCNVFWQVGSSATIGTDTVFVGNILALTSISLTTGASVSGRALARNGAVTLDTNHVGFEACAVPTASPTPTAAPIATPTASPSPTPVGQTTSPTPVGQTPSPTPAGQTPSPVPTPTPVGETPSPTPVGQTPSPTPSPTPVGQTPSPTPVGQTPSPTPVGQTPSPTPTPTPAGPTPPVTPPAPTDTPSGTLPPPPAPTNTPSLTPGPGFPNTGGPPSQTGLPWMTLLFGLALSSLSATAFCLSRRGQRPASEEARR